MSDPLDTTAEIKLRRKVSTRQFVVCLIGFLAILWHFLGSPGLPVLQDKGVEPTVHLLVLGLISVLCLVGMFIDFYRVTDWTVAFVKNSKWGNPSPPPPGN